MIKRQCPKCIDTHEIYYLLKTNNEKAMFLMCPKMKVRDLLFVYFIPIEHNLSIPLYKSGSPEYDALKDNLVPINDFSEEEQRIIKLWKRAKLTLRNMTSDQLAVIRTYIKEDIRW